VNNSIIIDKEKVSLRINRVFAVIEIEYVGNLDIYQLLPDSYYINKSNDKILIINFSNDNYVDGFNNVDLFSYQGKPLFINVYFYDRFKNKKKLNKQISEKQSWKNLKETWGNITTKYKDLNYTGNNNELKITKQIVDRDEFGAIRTQTKEIRKKDG
jgi:hypothetical protein